MCFFKVRKSAESCVRFYVYWFVGKDPNESLNCGINSNGCSDFPVLLLMFLFTMCRPPPRRAVKAENECSRGKPSGPCHARVTQEEGLAMRHVRAKVKTRHTASSLQHEHTLQEECSGTLSDRPKHE